MLGLIVDFRNMKIKKERKTLPHRLVKRSSSNRSSLTLNTLFFFFLGAFGPPIFCVVLVAAKVYLFLFDMSKNSFFFCVYSLSSSTQFFFFSHKINNKDPFRKIICVYFAHSHFLK